MGDMDDYNHPPSVEIPKPKPLLKYLKSCFKETFFPEDPFRQFKKQPAWTKFTMGLQYFIPILEWLPQYNFEFFKADLLAGITIASLAVPQGISYASLAKLPPIFGLYSSFVPPLVYAMLGSSRDVAIGNVSVPSLLIASIIGKEVDPSQNFKLYIQLALTATFFAGVFQAAMGFLRLGVIVDFLSHATIVGFMSGAAIVVCLQQLKGVLGLTHFTIETDIVSVMRSVFSQTHQWRWETAIMGFCFLVILLLTKHLSKRKGIFFWINAMAPLASVIVATVIVHLTNAEDHGVQVIGQLKKGVNPLTVSELAFGSEHLMIAVKTAIIIGIIAIAEGIAVGRSFAAFKNYHVDGNKEMVAFGMMNIAGSCTSCYLTTAPFSRTAVNYNAGCKSAVSNMVMATALLITLLFLTPLFLHTPLVVLSSILLSAMLGLIDYESAIHLWKVDKFDFLVSISAFIGVVFSSVETGLVIAIALSLLRMLFAVARPRTSVLGNIPNTTIYRNIDQYPIANKIPGILIVQIDAPFFFANTNYLRERISRFIEEEEDMLKSAKGPKLQFVILDLTSVGSIDTSGISMLEEVKKNIDRMNLKLVLANPQSELIKKIDKSNFYKEIGQEWIYVTVGEAVEASKLMLHKLKSDPVANEFDAQENV